MTALTAIRVSITALLLVMPGSAVFAQQLAEDVVEQGQSTAVEVDRSRLLYIDRPIAVDAPPVETSNIEPAVDPIVADPQAGGEPDSSTTRPDPEDDPEFIRRLESIRLYASSVESIEANGGAWDQSLIQELVSMGSLLQQQDAHPEAIEVFERAIHLNRIGSGLNSVEQIPIIQRMIGSHIALGNWGQVDIYNNYLFYIQQKAYGFNDPRIIPALESMATWHVQAFRIGYGEMLGLRLSSSQMLFDAAARMVGLHFGKQDQRYISNLQKSASSAYLATRNVSLMAEIDRPDIRNTQQILYQQLNDGRTSFPRSYETGEAALQKIINFHLELGDSAYDLAEAITNLGDWYLVFNRRFAAEEQYKAAWLFLNDLEDAAELRERLFGQVVPLPTFLRSVDNLRTQSEEPGAGSSLNWDFADMVFDVSDTGAVRNIQMLTEETEENSLQLSKLRRSVRTSVFRPVMLDGELVSSEQNYFRYRYWY